MNQGECGKPESEPANPPRRDGREGKLARIRIHDGDKSGDAQSKNKAGDKTDSPEGQPGNPESKRGSEGASPESTSSKQAAESPKTTGKSDTSERGDKNEAGDNKNPGGAEPSGKPKEWGQTADGKPGDNKNADGTEPNSDAKEGSGSKPGDSPDGSRRAGTPIKSPVQRRLLSSSQDAMKPNDPRNAQSVLRARKRSWRPRESAARRRWQVQGASLRDKAQATTARLPIPRPISKKNPGEEPRRLRAR